ncbi:MAG: hypothetical protein AAF226_11970 [Verrucomicrobiota bacterium]
MNSQGQKSPVNRLIWFILVGGLLVAGWFLYSKYRESPELSLESLNSAPSEYEDAFPISIDDLELSLEPLNSVSSEYEDAFPVPIDDQLPLGDTRKLIGVFLGAQTWQDRIEFTFRGDAKKEEIEAYYEGNPFVDYSDFDLEFLQSEADEDLGGPYWVYMANLGKKRGVPIIVRMEGDQLKVDWNVFAEFHDQHFAASKKGRMELPRSFRLVVERASEYYGPDRDRFPGIDDYLICKVSSPLDLTARDWVFVKKGTPQAKELDQVLKVGDDPLAMIIELDLKTFSHDINHWMVSDVVSEGWFLE